jgi:hypothetical protein
VGWPVVALRGGERDAHAWLRALEEALLRTVGGFGIHAWREAGLTGVWTERGKIAAIGVRLAHGWITAHGFALNVAADVSGFSAIVPCGIRGRDVASLAGCGVGPVALPEVGRIVADPSRGGAGSPLAHGGGGMSGAVHHRPPWLKIRLKTDATFREVRSMVGELRLNTVCVEARCPNIYECWNAGTATFMILGDVCTRRCGFCNVTSGPPLPRWTARSPSTWRRRWRAWGWCTP